jgi:tetratricopeptide (TPR) repeat protein
MTRWVVLVVILSSIVPPSFAADALREAESLLLAQRTRPDAAQFARAKEIASAEVKRSPGEARGWLLLAWSQMIEHRFAEALDSARTAERLAPRDARALALASDALVELGRYDEAVIVTQQLADNAPGIPAWTRAAHLRFLLGDLDGAIELASRAARAGRPRTEATAWSWVDLARLYSYAGNHDAAAAAIAAAETAFAGLPGLAAAKARLLVERGDVKGALNLYRKSLAAQPNAEDALAAWRLASRLGETGSVRHFAALLDGMAKLDTTGQSRRTLAEYFIEAGQVQRALALATQELAVRPDVYTHAVLARALQADGQIAQAREHARRAVAYRTADPELQSGMRAILGAQNEVANEAPP